MLYSLLKNPIQYWKKAIIGGDSIFKKNLLSTDDDVLSNTYNYYYFFNFSYYVVVLHCIFKICSLLFSISILNQILVLSILN